MAEHRGAGKDTESPPEPREVNINDIGQRTVNSTTTVLLGPDGTVATMHLAWVMTLDPLNDDNEPIVTNESGNFTAEDERNLADGGYVLGHGCEDRDFFWVESDPTAARGYATASAANSLVALINKSGYKVEPPAPPAEDGTPDIRKAPSSQGAIGNTPVKPGDNPVRQNVTVAEKK